jgi:hypothetical protein
MRSETLQRHSRRAPHDIARDLLTTLVLLRLFDNLEPEEVSRVEVEVIAR